MKTKKLNFLLAILLLTPLALLQAQENKNQAFYIHEDQVKPSKIQEYEKVSKEFAEACKTHKLPDVSWNTAATTTGRYLTIAPIENMAELDKNVFTPLMEKMGEDAFTDIFKRFNECYDKHGDYVVYLNNELTYMPEGVSTTTEGENFRKWHFLHVAPNNIQNLKGKLKEIRTMFAKKGSKEYYRVYHNGFGNMGDYYVVVLSAKDAEDYEKKSAANDVLIGVEGKELLGEMFKYVLKYEVETGEMRPDLSYSPSN